MFKKSLKIPENIHEKNENDIHARTPTPEPVSTRLLLVPLECFIKLSNFENVITRPRREERERMRSERAREGRRESV